MHLTFIYADRPYKANLENWKLLSETEYHYTLSNPDKFKIIKVRKNISVEELREKLSTG